MRTDMSMTNNTARRFDTADTNNIIVIGIDHGFGNMKTANTVFKTGVTVYDKEPHEGVSARNMEKAGYDSERCEINRQIREDNTIIRGLKSVITKMAETIQTTIPAIAHAMEMVRQNMIVFNYGLLHLHRRRDEAKEYLAKAKPQYRSYLKYCDEIKSETE